MSPSHRVEAGLQQAVFEGDEVACAAYKDWLVENGRPEGIAEALWSTPRLCLGGPANGQRTQCNATELVLNGSTYRRGVLRYCGKKYLLWVDSSVKPDEVLDELFRNTARLGRWW